MTPTAVVAQAEADTSIEAMARLAPVLDDAVAALERSGPGEHGWLRRALAVRARWSLLTGDRDGAARTVRRLDEISRGGQDRWFAATTRLLECELLLADGHATGAARKLDALARWLRARAEAPPGLVQSVMASRVLAHLASGHVAAMARAVDDLERATPAAPLAALGRGFVSEHAGDVTTACAHYQRATAGPPMCALEAHLALARLGDGSADHLRAAAALAGGDHPRVVAARAQSELVSGRYAQAVAIASRLREVASAEALLVCAEVACAAASPDARDRVTLLGLWAHEHAAACLEAHAYLLAARIATDPAERATSIRLASAIAVELGDPLLSMRVDLEQAMLEVELGRPDLALKTALDLESSALGRCRVDLVAGAVLVRGLAMQALGHEGAVGHLRRAGELAAAHGQISIVARALAALGRGAEAHSLRLEAGIGGPASRTAAE